MSRFELSGIIINIIYFILGVMLAWQSIRVLTVVNTTYVYRLVASSYGSLTCAIPNLSVLSYRVSGKLM